MPLSSVDSWDSLRMVSTLAFISYSFIANNEQLPLQVQLLYAPTPIVTLVFQHTWQMLTALEMS